MKTVKQIRIFVPSKDFELSQKFYQALGWKMQLVDEGLADMELEGHHFFLQKFYNKDWANNFMIHVVVDDVQAWYEHAKSIIKTGDFAPARVASPKDEGYAHVSYVWDPSGVLIHFAQFKN